MRNMEFVVKRKRSLRIRNRSSCFYGCSDLILVNILSRLPVKSLMRFKSVCKHWRSMIKQEECLIKLHEENRCKDIISFLVCPWPHPLAKKPQYPFPGRLEIRSILLSKEDLGFDTDKRGNITVVTLCRNLILNAAFNMLEPVCGLVCFVNCEEPGSVLICNPCTREITPWIQTITSEVFANKYLEEEVMESSENIRFGYQHLFGFGFDPTTKQHKVLGVCEITVCWCETWAGRVGKDFFPMVLDSEVICGVFTVGENRWRKIDGHQVPPNIILCNKKSVYVNGSICWIKYQEENEVIVFDVGSVNTSNNMVTTCSQSGAESSETVSPKPIQSSLHCTPTII